MSDMMMKYRFAIFTFIFIIELISGRFFFLNDKISLYFFLFYGFYIILFIFCYQEEAEARKINKNTKFFNRRQHPHSETKN